MGKGLIYVAGNPSAYPVEYYDTVEKTYDGIIPRILEEFAKESGYEIQYYKDDGNDNRRQFAADKQVDLISGYTEGDNLPENLETITVFVAERNGKEKDYYLCFTDASTLEFQTELKEYVSDLSQEKITGLAIDSAQISVKNQDLYWVIESLAITVLILVISIILLVRRYRKKLKLVLNDVETDEITGLGNMEYLQRYYLQYINDKNRILYQAIYFYVDTDHLKRVSGNNETEEFLRYCALILGEYVGDSDILARVSEHGFVVLKMSESMEKVDEWLCTILERSRNYSKQYNKSFGTEMYAGVYQLQASDRDLNEIIFQASQGAYTAQKEEEPYLICSNNMMKKHVKNIQLQSSINQAFSNNEFQLYLQFYVNAKTFEIVGGELLSRWNHPQHGLLSPAEFIPLMEGEKLISRLDYYSLNLACKFLESLKEIEIDDFFISCNFSRETFSSLDFVENVKKIIDKYSFPKELLVFEITESLIVKNTEQILKNIILLKDYGVKIALDDFGEGFTSFYDLQKYPIDGVKLDKGLVDHILTHSGNSILRAMIQVGHELGMTILAEGVENDDQVKALQDIDCDVIQGFRFYQPLPQWEAVKIIRDLYRK